MIRVTVTGGVPVEALTDAIGREPAEFANVMSLLALRGDSRFNEGVLAHIRTWLHPDERRYLRDLALLIAGACGEAG